MVSESCHYVGAYIAEFFATDDLTKTFDLNLYSFEARPDTRNPSRGRLGRGSEAKTPTNQIRTDGRIDTCKVHGQALPWS